MFDIKKQFQLDVTYFLRFTLHPGPSLEFAEMRGNWGSLKNFEEIRARMILSSH